VSYLVEAVAPGVFRVADVCNVYVIRDEAQADGQRSAVAIDFGTGLVLDHLGEMGVDRLTDVLMTHHHRDQGQGLRRAAAAGIRIHVPPVEQDLFASVDEFWRTRPLRNDYVLRQDRFSLLEPVPVTGVVPEYRTATYAGTPVEVLPTPGHTTGSVTYLVRRAGQLLAFTGDLIYAPGKVWSLAATQWSYSGSEGPAMTVFSCLDLMERAPTRLLPSHGRVMDEPRAALELLALRLQRYVDARRPRPWDLRAQYANPYRRLTQHLLQNRGSHALNLVLLSASGAALFIDFGYDMTSGLPGGVDRASRRPWLASLPALRRDYGVTSIDAALPTHYHDDHVAGMNLLRDVEGTQVWAPAHIVDVLENPGAYDLPCLWYDPIPVDRALPLEQTLTWHEHSIVVHELRGHTVFAAAYEFTVDGVKVLVTGDQQDCCGVPGEQPELMNFQYRNRFDIDDFRRAALLYRKVEPDLIVSGHWAPRWVDDAYLDLLETAADRAAELHRELLPQERWNLGSAGIVARIEPYLSAVEAGGTAHFRVAVHNPYPDEQPAAVRLVTPADWPAASVGTTLRLPGSGDAVVELTSRVAASAARRARVAVDVTVGELHLGQQAEALVDVVETLARGAAT
jgi:glyoxylase-like metal-dependent hydrolase (beta-lactamase superfamily II)